jgi:uncharacterized membrane protein YbjE (DUF340 family)
VADYLAVHYLAEGKRAGDWIVWDLFFAVGVSLLIAESAHGHSSDYDLVFAAALTAAGLIRLVLLFSTRRRQAQYNEERSASSA